MQERRGRLPIHTFLDYVFTNFVIAIIFALTARAPFSINNTQVLPCLSIRSRVQSCQISPYIRIAKMDALYSTCAYNLVLRTHRPVMTLQFGQIGNSTPETPNFITQIHQVCEVSVFCLPFASINSFSAAAPHDAQTWRRLRRPDRRLQSGLAQADACCRQPRLAFVHIIQCLHSTNDPLQNDGASAGFALAGSVCLHQHCKFLGEKLVSSMRKH